MFTQPYHKLLAWKAADEFAQAVYKATKQYPKDELYGMTSQLRRAALSVVLNLVEGQARGGRKDFVRFLMMSRGSISECAYLLELSQKLGYLDQEKYRILDEMRYEASFPLQRMIQSLQQRL